jgi:GNAT superfamily N-acetyltransferase
MEPLYKLRLEAAPDPGDMNVIFYGLRAFNSLNTGGTTPEYLVFTMRDDDDTVIGGLVGKTYVEWLYVQALWLPEGLRGRGHGSSLLAAAEEEARRRGCGNAWLDTFSFQALPFYQKLGYMVFAQLPDFPPGGVKYFLTKSLKE